MAKPKFHGDESRFREVADFIDDYFGNTIKYIADVAGGQGMLTRILRKKYNYIAEVVDPRGYTLRGVPSRKEIYDKSMTDYYDLIVGLHPDEALRPVVESAHIRPVLVIPCCNFWDKSRRLGRDALINEIEKYFIKHQINFKRIMFDFNSPYKIGIVTRA